MTEPVHQAAQRAAKALHAAARRYDRGLLLREIAVRLIVVQAVLAVVGIVTGSTSALSLATGVLAAGALFVSLRVQQTAARQISELHDTIIALAGEGVWPGPAPAGPPRTPRRADSLLAQTFALFGLFGCLTLTFSSGAGAAAMAFALSLPVAVVTTGLAVLSRSARARALAAAASPQEGVSVRNRTAGALRDLRRPVQRCCRQGRRGRCAGLGDLQRLRPAGTHAACALAASRSRWHAPTSGDDTRHAPLGGRVLRTRLICAAAAAILSAGLAAAPASAAPKRCGAVKAFAGSKLDVYRVAGNVGCGYALRAARKAIGTVCEGEVVYDGLRCTHGAPRIGAPARSDGFTLRRGKVNIQAKQRR